jgi:CPA2 family monovalent cation:H+ antiporter-2
MAVRPRIRYAEPTVDLTADLTLVIVAGLAGGLIARWLRQPLVLGYLLAGIAVGPHTGGLTVGNPANIEHLADIGVTLLLFGLGLELSLKDLAPVRRVALIGTPIQLTLTALVAGLFGTALGFDWRTSVWLGALVSLSSTLVALKALQSQGRMGTLSSRVMLGMLVAQDLAFIPLVIVLPQLGTGAIDVGAGVRAAGLAIVFLAVLFVAGTRVFPRVIAWAARSGSRELFLLVTLALALGIGYGSHAMGVSAAVGAFVAGLILSESDYSHQALSDIIPLRDVFSVLFFASVGMLLDPAWIASHAALVSATIAVVTVGKAGIFFGVTRALGYRNVVPLASALTLFQVGEFSFVLARTGVRAGLVSDDLYALVLNTAVVTMALTPVVSAATHPLYTWINRRRPRDPIQTINLPTEHLADHVVVAGAGRVGGHVAEVLQRLGRPFVLVELDHTRFAALRDRGWPVVYGDVERPVVLEAAGIEHARLLLVTVPSESVAAAVIATARAVSPTIPVIARAEVTEAIGRLRATGITEVVVPSVEASLELTRQALLHLGLAAAEVAGHVDRLRSETYGAAAPMPDASRDGAG